VKKAVWIPAVKLILIMTILTGLIYPLAVTGLADLLFPAQANGSLLATASGSGLDPHISKAAALYQVPRVAAARGIPADKLTALVHSLAEPPQFGLLGEERANVLQLNLALDAGS
jgi:K+-transporting ATPase c subunit